MNFFSWRYAQDSESDVPVDKCRAKGGPDNCSVHGPMLRDQDNADRLEKGSPDSSALDAEYMEAVKNRDFGKCRKMVLDAAERAMPNSKIRGHDGNLLVLFHGSSSSENFNEFDTDGRGETSDTFGTGAWFTIDHENARSYARNAKDGKGIVKNCFLNIENFYLFDAGGSAWDNVDLPDGMTSTEKLEAKFLKDKTTGKTVGTIILEHLSSCITLRDAMADREKWYAEDRLRVLKKTDPSIGRIRDKIPKFISDNLSWEDGFVEVEHDEGTVNDIVQHVREDENNYDGCVIANVKDGGGNLLDDIADELEEQGQMIDQGGPISNRAITTDVVAFKPNQIKSADSVTYDDDGKVIPLSKRFQMDNPDIRY